MQAKPDVPFQTGYIPVLDGGATRLKPGSGPKPAAGIGLLSTEL